jgi:hypothetical protein
MASTPLSIRDLTDLDAQEKMQSKVPSPLPSFIEKKVTLLDNIET